MLCSRLWNPPQDYGDRSAQAHEAFIFAFITMHGLCHDGPAPAAQCRPRADLDLPAHDVAAGRIQLPASADLFGLWRRGDRTFRIVGRRMDDAGAIAALPALGHLRHRQCAADPTAGRAMVPSVEIWTLARRQRPLRILLRGFQASRALLRHGNFGSTIALI